MPPLMLSVDMTSAVNHRDDIGIENVDSPDGSWWLLEPPGETEPVTATVDHADIRGLVTTLLVSVAAPAAL